MNLQTTLRKNQGLLITLGLIAAILIGLTLAIEYYLGPLAKNIVLQQTKTLFGDSLMIDSIQISLWRGSIIIKNVDLVQPKRFGTGSLLKANTIRLQADLISLLREQLLINTIVINKPEVNLIQLSNGEMNTEFYLAKLNQPRSSSSQNTLATHLSRFRINDGRFSFTSYKLTDRQPAFLVTKSRLELQNLNLPNPLRKPSPFSFTGTIASGHPAGLKVDGQGVFGGTTPSFQVNTKISGLELSDFAYLFSDSAVTVQSGKVWVDSQARCTDNYLTSLQHVEIKQMKISSTKGGWVGAIFLGLPAKGFATFIEDNNGALNFDFQVSGDYNHLKANYKEAIATAITNSLQAKLSFLSPVNQAGQSVVKGIKNTGTKVKETINKVFKLGK